jgi:multiple sugar transport system substrate-binding protein/putative aldouronate transport system substrate-binding protein
MIFAADDAEFDKIWDEMTVQLEGFDYNELVKFDTEKHTIELQAKQAAK